jgi:ATP-dependent Zn protease
MVIKVKKTLMSDQINETAFLKMKACEEMPDAYDQQACFENLAKKDDKAKQNRQVLGVLVIFLPILLLLGVLFFVAYKYQK